MYIGHQLSSIEIVWVIFMLWWSPALLWLAYALWKHKI